MAKMIDKLDFKQLVELYCQYVIIERKKEMMRKIRKREDDHAIRDFIREVCDQERNWKLEFIVREKVVKESELAMAREVEEPLFREWPHLAQVEDDKMEEPKMEMVSLQPARLVVAA